jgi:DHA1 family bicyclomycin/chloramphenicol resistance-like MFS transporter
VIVIPRSVVRDLFDERDSARLYSMLMLVMGLAPITAPLIGGQLLVISGWRTIFWILAVFGLLCWSLIAFCLPETLSPDQRSSGKISEALRTYRRLLGDRRFVGYALAGGLLAAGMFAYISGSPFVFIELYGVAPERYGWIFGANALGLILVSQANRKLLARYEADTILSRVLLVVAAAGVMLAAIAAAGVGGLAALLVPLFVCIAALGLVAPNAAAAAMAPHGKVAGTASALMGTLQLAVGAAAGILVGVLHDGTALPMCGVIAVCSVASLLVFQSLALRGGRTTVITTNVESARPTRSAIDRDSSRTAVEVKKGPLNLRARPFFVLFSRLILK